MPIRSLLISQRQMTTTPITRRPIRHLEPESHKKFHSINPTTITPSTTHQEAISEDLIIALEATERLNKSLDRLAEENGCGEFLSSHRLLGEKITSNRNILLLLIGNAMDISIKTNKPEFKADYPDYFTK
jgi:hypothetical protein